MRVAFAVVLATGCGFSGPGLVAADATGDAGDDATPPRPRDIAHVGAAEEVSFAGTADLTIAVPTTIDTTTGMVSPALPAGATIVLAPQDAAPVGATPAPALAILEARSVAITAVVTIRGERPLVIAAVTTITVAPTGVLDASSHTRFAGGGGFGAGVGPGAGAAGKPGALYDDGGGGGGGFGGSGGKGGTAGSSIDAVGGAVYAPLLVTLIGGSGGGAASPACRAGGAGGGAIELSAPSVMVAGAITVGGGGGEGGNDCDSNWLSGAGGGSGGAIYIQADQLVGNGMLAANGGGGGGGSVYGTTFGTDGDDGPMTATGARGGPGSAGQSGAGAGGDGGWRDRGARGGTTVTAGDASLGHDAGGGGGGAGLIVLDLPPAATPTVVASPAAQRR